MLPASVYGIPIRRFQCMQRVFMLKPGEQARQISDSSVKDKNLYKILGVSRKATQTEIKDAYYNLTVKFHPDKNEGSPEAAVKFHEITEAYDVLGNYFMRKRYDKGLPLPTRHEIPSDVSSPHVVQYQKFFDSRNLPYQPSAYAAGGGARKFDEFHAKQFSDHRLRSLTTDEEREYIESCNSKKTPSLIALVLLLYFIKQIKENLGIEYGPRVTIEDYDV